MVAFRPVPCKVSLRAESRERTQTRGSEALPCTRDRVTVQGRHGLRAPHGGVVQVDRFAPVSSVRSLSTARDDRSWVDTPSSFDVGCSMLNVRCSLHALILQSALFLAATAGSLPAADLFRIDFEDYVPGRLVEGQPPQSETYQWTQSADAATVQEKLSHGGRRVRCKYVGYAKHLDVFRLGVLHKYGSLCLELRRTPTSDDEDSNINITRTSVAIWLKPQRLLQS